MSDSGLLKLLIVGDTRLYCDGVAHLLRPDTRFAVIGIAYSGAEALGWIASSAFDIALVDIGMTQGWHVVRTIARNAPSTQVVALGIGETQEDILLCAEAGAAGYVPRNASVKELVEALVCAHNGELRCSPRVAATLLKRIAVLAAVTGAGAIAHSRVLTQREREIAELIALRMSNKQIARRLGIENATVKNHVHNILDKLRLRRRQEIQVPASPLPPSQPLLPVI